MSGIWILGGTILIFIVAYITYGSWLARQWGVDPSKETPAHTLDDGTDYVPVKAPVLLGHHFSSIAGPGAIHGPMQAAIFGWVPVLLWIVIGGIFFGAVQDFSALFASVRHKGKSLGGVIEENIGRKSKLCFNIFAWMVVVLMVAALVDIVAGTFAGFTLDTVSGEMVKNSANGSVATASMLFIPLAVCFGFINRANAPLALTTVIGVLMLGGCVTLGLFYPVYLTKTVWLAVIFLYIFAASVTPVWILLQPRDYLNSFLLYLTMAAAIIGIVIANPSVKLEPFTGWSVDGNMLFPFLFVTVSCGAVSGIHSLVGSGVTSKQLNTEKSVKLIGYGAMLMEGVLAVIALIAVGYLTKDGVYTEIGTPLQVFSAAIGKFFSAMGINAYGERLLDTIVLLAISAFALTSLDMATRVGRVLFQELFEKQGERNKFFGNGCVATFLTLAAAGALSLAGYQKIWALFGACNQLVAAFSFLAVACWLKRIGRAHKMLYFPMVFLLVATLSSLGMTFYKNLMTLLQKGVGVSWMVQGVQNVLIAPIFAMAVIMAVDGCRVLFRKKKLN